MLLLRSWLLATVTALLIALALPARADATPTEVTPTPLPGATFNNPYAVQLYVLDEHGSFEQGTFTWILVDGALPPGLSMSATGVILGSPQQTGDYVFTVRATGAAGTIAASKAIHVDLVDPAVSNGVNQLVGQLSGQTSVVGLVVGLVSRNLGCALSPGELQATLSTLLYGTPPQTC